MNKFYLVFYLISFFCLINSVMSYWEYAVSNKNQINLYDAKWNYLTSVNHFENPASIAFDETNEKIYFTDQKHKTATIFSIKIPLYEIEIGSPIIQRYDVIVKRLYGNESVKSMAYDPLDEMLYWTDIKNRKIYKISINNTNNDNIKKKLQEPKIVIDFSKSNFEPDGIAIDFCNRKLYWTSYNHSVGKIERSSLDGTNHEIIEDTNLYYPHGIFIDYFEHRVYWVVDQPGVQYTVESSDGTPYGRKIHLKGREHRPVHLTVTKSNIYWTDTDNEAIWNISKDNDNIYQTPNKILDLNKNPTGLISRTEYLTDLHNDSQCKNVIAQIYYRETLKDPIDFNNTIDSTNELVETLCLNNADYNRNADKCICKPGFEGRRCEIDKCHNYCNNGECEFLSKPKCVCKHDFTGDRCEINKCNKFCVNNGTCAINMTNSEPHCLCSNGFTGERCQINKCHQYCLNNGTCTVYNDQPICYCVNGFNGKHCENNSTEICPLLCKLKKYGEISILPVGCNEQCDVVEVVNLPFDYKTNGSGRNIEICSNTYNRTIIFAILGVVVALLLVFLIVITLRKIYKPARPRIKKTFLVQKKLSQTPLTSRPVATEQCEIIIENCCNMNICDTPCFDPKLLQQSYDACPTDDKKQLINTSDNLTY